MLKGKDDGMVREIFVTTHAWRTGIRKVQTKLTNFYEMKMKYFAMVNSCEELKLELYEVEEKEWAKSCFSKMTAFCICG